MTHKQPRPIIKNVLKKRGISQVQASFDLDIFPSRLNQIVLGWCIPGIEIQDKFAEYLGLPRDELFPEGD